MVQVDSSEYGHGAALLQPVNHPNKSCDVHWQHVAYSSSVLSPTEQCYVQIEKETLAIVDAFQKFDQLLFRKSGITAHSYNKLLETIFKCLLVSALCRLQSMVLTLQRYLFQVEYRKGCSLLTHIGYSFSFTSVRDNTQKSMKIGLLCGV